jgi:hypothetical protein
MKNYIVLITFLVSSNVAFTQDILIPYKKGNQYGLCNQFGKIKLQPKYDNVKWLTAEYFETENRITLNDTLEVSPYNFHLRKNESVKMRGLIYKGNEIVSNQPYSGYNVYPTKCIIAKCETRFNKLTKEQFRAFNGRDKFVSLFNIYGKNVYTENFKKLELVDTIHLVLKNKEVKKLLLFNCENFRNRFSLFAFDIDKQNITDWVLKDVVKLRKTRGINDRNTISVDYVDSNGYMFTSLIDYTTEKFKLITKVTETVSERKYGNNGETNDRPAIEDYGRMSIVEAPPDGKDYVENPTKYVKPPFRPFYKRVDDSLFYVIDTDKKTYLNTEKETFYFSISGAKTQFEQPVIYQKNNRYGLIIKGKFEPNIYDSLFYFGANFLVYVKDDNNNKLKCGVIAANGDIKVPWIYDSIQGQMKEYTYGFDKIILSLKKDYSYNYSKPSKNRLITTSAQQMIVYKDGKFGMLSNDNRIIIPIKYDVVAANGLNSLQPNFIILKNGDKYGVTQLEWNKETKVYDMTNTIEPKFSAIPAYYYNNYYGIKGFKLFALYNETDKLISYANEDGYMYKSED